MRNIKFCKNTLKISIHAPREGSDGGPERGPGRAQAISIHAPREGSDVENTGTEQAAVANFYPRSPRGERRFKRDFANITTIFLSTLPARGATPAWAACSRMVDISIHAPREGSDTATGNRYPAHPHFYPRSPRGERPRPSGPKPWRVPNFYPRSPRGERPVRAGAEHHPRSISIHAPREGSDAGRAEL